MPQYTIHIERTYKDVSVQYVDADNEEAAQAEALVLARDDDPSEFSEVVTLEAIFTEVTPGTNDEDYEDE